MDRKFGMKVECCSEWSCGGSRRSSASSSSCCQGFRQLAVVAPLSPGGTSCSLVVWLSTGCSFSAGLPGDVHDTCWVKMVASLLLHSNSDFLSPICLRNSYHGFKHVSNASQTARMSHFTRQFFFMSCMHETVSVSPQCRSGNNKWIMGINAWIVHTLIVVKFLLIGSCTSEWIFLIYCQSTFSTVSFFFSAPSSMVPLSYTFPRRQRHISVVSRYFAVRAARTDEEETQGENEREHLF